VGQLGRRLAKFVSGGAKSASLLARLVRKLARFVRRGVKNVDNFGELGRKWVDQWISLVCFSSNSFHNNIDFPTLLTHITSLFSA